MYDVAIAKSIALFSSSQFMTDVCRDLLSADFAIMATSNLSEILNSACKNFQLTIIDCIHTDLEKIKRHVKNLNTLSTNILLLVKHSCPDKSFLQKIFPTSTLLYFPCEPCFFNSVVTEKYKSFCNDSYFKHNFFMSQKSYEPFSSEVSGFEKIISCSKAMTEVKKTLAVVSASDISILLLGESGTGKSFAAEIIHDNSSRKNKIFKSINMAAIPEALAESTLFGSVKGAYTGAVNRAGIFSEAAGGTIFMDEIAEMSLALQSKLLTFLDTKKFYSVGSDEEKKVDVRLIFATNENLKSLVRAGKFRKDLYYRICKMKVVFPPLRERPEDIKLIATDWLSKFHKTLSPEAVEKLCRHSWYGNTRELLNCIETASSLCQESVIEASHILLDDDIF